MPGMQLITMQLSTTICSHCNNKNHFATVHHKINDTINALIAHVKYQSDTNSYTIVSANNIKEIIVSIKSLLQNNYISLSASKSFQKWSQYMFSRHWTTRSDTIRLIPCHKKVQLYVDPAFSVKDGYRCVPRSTITPPTITYLWWSYSHIPGPILESVWVQFFKKRGNVEKGQNIWKFGQKILQNLKVFWKKAGDYMK